MDAAANTGSYMSVDAFARSIGKSSRAIRLAIDKGALATALVWVNGKPKIADAARAQELYQANTRPRKAPSGDERADGGYADLRRRREEELWRQAQIKREEDELNLAVRKGEFVRASDVAADLAEEYAAVKTHLLALSARVKQRLPHLSMVDVRVIDDLVREALTELANGADE